MTFDRFAAHFSRDAFEHGRDACRSAVAAGIAADFFVRFGGESFNRGIYRVVSAESFALARGFIGEGFPDLAHRATPFAYDWLGRIFALDGSRTVGGSAGVLIIEPGTGEILEVPCNLISFHDDELVSHGDAALAASFHANWLANGGLIPRRDQCIGYRVHLFLGGEDTLDNLEIADLAVYWAISAQLIARTRDLPPGTAIGKVELRVRKDGS